MEMSESFRLQAAGFYLSGDADAGLKVLDECYEKNIDLSEHENEHDVIIWQPFENHSAEYIVTLINDLAEHFERIYKEGEQACQNK